MNFTETNNLIAQFMGFTSNPSNKSQWYEGRDMQKAGLPFNCGAMGNGMNEIPFSSLWEWLMPVIATIKDNDPNDRAVHLIDKIDQALMQTNITETHEAVVEFIEWYNKHKSINKHPNGLTSWKETHFEVVAEIAIEWHGHSPQGVVKERAEKQGRGGLYELAEELTDKFEALNNGREWDGEFFDEIEKFLEIELKAN